MNRSRELYLLFADLLEYPTPNLKQRVENCTGILLQLYPCAAEELTGFRCWLEKQSLAQVEETYTSTFDLQGVCCPYLGHYLYGDNYQRSWFMAQLNEGYRKMGFTCGSELPDHISVILRFLALGDKNEFSQVLREEGLIPSLEKMLQSFDEDGNHPYRQVLKSLFHLLQVEMPEHISCPTGPELGGLKNA